MGKKLGVSGNWISLLESGSDKARPSDQLIMAVSNMTQGQGQSRYQEPMVLREEPPPYRVGPRMIPVLGWAHAGDAETYEEIPASWQDRVPTESRDPKAFAVKLEGDSMEPKFSSGDVLILQPSGEFYNGCLAVIKLKSDGFLFRRVERRPDFIRLIPLNPQWIVEDLPNDQVAWVYPLWGMWRQIAR